MKLARLIARLLLGALFAGHGAQKLLGWFGGPGMSGTERMVGALDMEPRRRNAMAVGTAEAAGGAMLAAGAFTPVAAAGLIATMVTAIRKVHLPKGFWNAGGGYEFNLSLIAALLLLVDGGPGRLSVDGAIGIDETGTRWALAALVAGVAGSTLAIAAGEAEAARIREAELTKQPS
jgi:putative oxidoreductase